jgi:hypothetical protein
MTSTIKVNKIEKESGSTLTLGGPSTAVTLACGATQTGFGRTGTVDWCTTAKTSPFTAVSGDGFFINTTSGGITVTLPSSPSAGDIVAFKDYASTWDTNNVTICRGGSKINGQCTNSILDTESQSVTLIYVDGTKGWQDIQDSTANVTGTTFMSASGGNTTITCGNFKTHIFTASGCFAVSSVSNVTANNAVDYLVIAGGGYGGNGACSSGYAGGGGGAGGFRLFSSAPGSNSPLVAPAGHTVSVQTYPIAVGAGGTNPGTGGSVSTFSTITSAGGGAGATKNAPTPSEPPSTRKNGHPGGSGGGASSMAPSCGTGGTGNTPPVSPVQGTDGGDGTQANNTAGGGGGGAGAAGSDGAPGSAGGAGGAGSYIADPFIGPTAPSYGTPGPVSNTRFFAGGGGGASGVHPSSAGSSAGAGGAGGATAGVTTGQTTAATANTGSGAGGSSGANNPGPNGHATGGSGIVMIRYRFQ